MKGCCPLNFLYSSLTPTLPGTFVAGQNVEGRTNLLKNNR